jgi:hypothetical protein
MAPEARMKALDVLGTGAKVVKAAIAAVVAPSPRRSREAEEEMERRAQINAAAEAERWRRAQTWSRLLDDRPSWLGPRRHHWLR